VDNLDINLGDGLNYFHNGMSGFFGVTLCILHDDRCRLLFRKYNGFNGYY
jgi:hypothetical protein